MLHVGNFRNFITVKVISILNLFVTGEIFLINVNNMNFCIKIM